LKLIDTQPVTSHDNGTKHYLAKHSMECNLILAVDETFCETLTPTNRFLNPSPNSDPNPTHPTNPNQP